MTSNFNTNVNLVDFACIKIFQNTCLVVILIIIIMNMFTKYATVAWRV